MKIARKGLFSLFVVGGLSLGWGQSLYAFSPADVFNINPSAVAGEVQGPFTASYINMSYNALVDQTITGGPGVGTFQEQGFAQFTAFLDAAKAPIGAGTTGLNLGPGTTGYDLYLTFTAVGTVAPTNPADLTQGNTATFSSFNFNFYMDRDNNTTFADLSTLVGGADEDGAVTNTTPFVTGGTADDVLLAHNGVFVSGVAHAFAQQAQGDFDVITQFLRDSGFFADPFFAQLFILFNPNGNNEAITLPGGTTATGNFTDAHFRGNGDVSFLAVPVPEPSSLFLLGAGLLGVARFARRRFGKK